MPKFVIEKWFQLKLIFVRLRVKYHPLNNYKNKQKKERVRKQRKEFKRKKVEEKKILFVCLLFVTVL